MSTPTLYEYSVCPFCWKVKAILDYKGIPYQRVEVNPMNKKEISFSKEYKKVPIFVTEDGNQINDSTPIMRYIDSLNPNKPVFETNLQNKEIEEKWLNWSNDVLAKSLVPWIYRSFPQSIKAFNYISRSESFSWIQRQYIKYMGAIFMTLVAKKSAKRLEIENPEKHLKNCLNEWGKALQGRPTLNGKQPNGADLSVFGILRCLKDVSAFEPVQENKEVHQWFERIEQSRV